MSKRPLFAGVMGWPAAHSRSPLLHNYWLKAHQIAGAYVKLPVAPEHAAIALRNLARMGFAGCNVTVPHKEAAFAAMDQLSDPARRARAVNTVMVREDGALYGDNTDIFGFAENLADHTGLRRLDGARIVILGAGGAARAVLIACLDAGARDIVIVNRSRARADTLARDSATPGAKISVHDGRIADVIAGADLLINTTSLGQHKNPALPLGADDLMRLARGACVADIVYVPLETRLIRDARACGFKAAPGLGMLLHQARPGFAAWFGVMPKVTRELHDHIAATIPATKDDGEA
ncbi:MAG TPA: shikimate dehydrogenase [Micropepsaceae bacterium]|nr:shikimate dehydrogenase [Micropepsaceae bacterium]